MVQSLTLRAGPEEYAPRAPGPGRKAGSWCSRNRLVGVTVFSRHYTLGMPAYLIADVTVTDPGRYPDYVRLVPATLEPYGGRFIVRGGATEIAEGDWQPQRLVIIEFPSLERAKAWYDSPEYAPAKRLRQQCSDGRLLFVEGAPPA